MEFARSACFFILFLHKSYYTTNILKSVLQLYILILIILNFSIPNQMLITFFTVTFYLTAIISFNFKAKLSLSFAPNYLTSSDRDGTRFDDSAGNFVKS